MPIEPDDPVALRSAWLFGAFGWYLRWFFWRNFRAVRYSGEIPAVPAGRPLIICTNHPSWWDPALFILLSVTLLPDRVGFGPMEAAALEKYRLFRRLGVYGIDTTGPRGGARFLKASLRILAKPGTALWITAEGHFTDPRLRPVRLRPGIAHLVRRMPDAVVVPLALEYAFWNERKPEALVRFGVPLAADPSRDVAGWTALLEQRLTETMDALAADATQRDPSLFRLVMRGRAGIGGIYDVWRRLTAWAHGRRAVLAHEDAGE